MLRNCKICGKLFKIKTEKSHICCCSKKCSEINRKNISKKWNEIYRSINPKYKPKKEIMEEQRKEDEIKKHKTIEEINELARKEGLSYGKYVAKYGL